MSRIDQKIWFESKIWKKNPGIPLSIDPLKYEENPERLEKLFAKNSYLDKIINEINQIINIENGDIKRIYIIGERGMGKSTLLNYLFMNFIKNGYFALYCDLLGGRKEEDADYNFLYSIYDGFYKSLKYFPKNLDKIKRKISNEDVNKLGKSVQLQSFLEKIIIDTSKKTKLIILIDEFDKKNPDIALNVLSNLQNFLNKKNVIFIFAGTPKWLDILNVQDYSGIDGKKFRLNTWDLEITKLALKRRLEEKFIFEEIIKDEAIREIIKRANGIPRYILTRINNILIEAGKRKIKLIDLKFVEEFGFWSLNSIENFKKFLNNNQKEKNLWQKLIDNRIIIRDIAARESAFSILIAIFNHNAVIVKPDQISREQLGINLSDYEFENAIFKLKNLKLIEERNKKYTLLALKRSFEYIRDELEENLIFLPYIIHNIIPKKEREMPIKGKTDKTEILKSFFLEYNEWIDKDSILKKLEERGEDITVLKYDFERYISPLISNKFIFYTEYDKKYKKVPDYLEKENLDLYILKHSNLIDYFSKVIFWINKNRPDNVIKNLAEIIKFLLNLIIESNQENRIKTIPEICDKYEDIILNFNFDNYNKELFIANINEFIKINEIKEFEIKKIRSIIQNLLYIAIEIYENLYNKKSIKKQKFNNGTEDQVLKEICKKIKKYREKTLEISDFKMYLDQIKNFAKDETHYKKLRQCMVFILKRLKDYYFTFNEMAEMINNEILKVLPKENIKTYFGLFEGLRPKSNTFWSYFIEKINKSKNKKIEILNIKEIIKRLENSSIDDEVYIIFIDDVVGTGCSFIKSYKKEFEPYIKNINISKDKVKVYLIAGIGSIESIDTISNNTDILKDRIRYSKLIRNEDKAFYENSWHNKEDLNLFKNFLKDLDPKYWDGWKPQGKKGLEYLIILEWNVPNNTISCLWKNAKNRNWKALFPRYN
ncbi:MAG: phosphoribosyltransferase-like protein [Candidatus Helarchaeota archaeon]